MTHDLGDITIVLDDFDLVGDVAFQQFEGAIDPFADIGSP